MRAGLIHDVFSAHQGVEDDDMNVFTLGGQVIGPALAWELIQMFLKARFSGAIRHQRRVDKVSALEIQPDVYKRQAHKLALHSAELFRSEERLRQEAFQPACPCNGVSVSYTHLDVYKRQPSGH